MYSRLIERIAVTRTRSLRRHSAVRSEPIGTPFHAIGVTRSLPRCLLVTPRALAEAGESGRGSDACSRSSTIWRVAMSTGLLPFARADILDCAAFDDKDSVRPPTFRMPPGTRADRPARSGCSRSRRAPVPETFLSARYPAAVVVEQRVAIQIHSPQLRAAERAGLLCGSRHARVAVGRKPLRRRAALVGAVYRIADSGNGMHADRRSFMLQMRGSTRQLSRGIAV